MVQELKFSTRILKNIFQRKFFFKFSFSLESKFLSSISLNNLFFSNFKNFILESEMKDQVINLQKASGQVFGGEFNVKALFKLSDTGININTNGLFEHVELASLKATDVKL